MMDKEKEQLLTEPECRLMTRYLELLKTMEHMNAIFTIVQEEKRRFGDIEDEIRRIATKVFAAHIQITVDASTFKKETPGAAKMVTCQLVRGNHCSICGLVILPNKDRCGSGHEIGQQYHDYNR